VDSVLEQTHKVMAAFNQLNVSEIPLEEMNLTVMNVDHAQEVPLPTSKRLSARPNLLYAHQSASTVMISATLVFHAHQVRLPTQTDSAATQDQLDSTKSEVLTQLTAISLPHAQVTATQMPLKPPVLIHR
jgi:hypothetical protein